jgi:hypothetical protein
MESSMIPSLLRFSQGRSEWKLLIVACLRLSEERPDGAFLSGEVMNLAQCQDRRPLTSLCMLGIEFAIRRACGKR